MSEQNNELRDFVKETLRQIKEGSQGHYLNDAVHFKIAIAKSVNKKGQLEVKVLGFGVLGGAGGSIDGEAKAEHASEVGFSIRIKDDVDDELGGITTGGDQLEDGKGW
jgi:hypothetical protein